jgi:hypothetical protein
MKDLQPIRMMLLDVELEVDYSWSGCGDTKL